MYILRFVCVFCTDHEFCSLVKLKKKAAMENNRSYIFQREKEVAILKKKLLRD